MDDDDFFLVTTLDYMDKVETSVERQKGSESCMSQTPSSIFASRLTSTCQSLVLGTRWLTKIITIRFIVQQVVERHWILVRRGLVSLTVREDRSSFRLSTSARLECWVKGASPSFLGQTRLHYGSCKITWLRKAVCQYRQRVYPMDACLRERESTAL